MNRIDIRCLVVVAAAVATSVPSAHSSAVEGAGAARFEVLVASGMQDIAPSELAVARELLAATGSMEQGAATRLDLQLGLLEAILQAHSLEVKAGELEREALVAEKAVDVEQAAYDFLVEQILASSVASFWSSP